MAAAGAQDDGAEPSTKPARMLMSQESRAELLSPSSMKKYKLNKKRRRAPTVFAHHPQQLTQIVLTGTNIGVDVIHNPQEAWLVEERLAAPLPDGWTECFDDEGSRFFRHGGESTWDNPLDEVFRHEVERWRMAKAKTEADRARAKAHKEAARLNRERARERIRARRGWPPKKASRVVSRKVILARARAALKRFVKTVGSVGHGLTAVLEESRREHPEHAAKAAIAEDKPPPSGPRANLQSPSGTLDWQYPIFTVEHLSQLVRHLRIDPHRHPALLWNASWYMDLSTPDSPLPAGWSMYHDADGKPYYHEAVTGDYTYLHPMSHIIRHQVLQAAAVPNAQRGLSSDRWWALSDRGGTGIVYYNVATGILRASPPDLSHESATTIQRIARGRLARMQAMKIREIELRKTPAQRLLEAERRYLERVRRQDAKANRMNRNGLAAAEKEQRSYGDAFWGLDLVAQRLHAAKMHAAHTKLQVAAHVAQEARRAIQLAEDLRQREEIAMRLRKELAAIAQARRRQEGVELGRMRVAEAEQRQNGDLFFGLDAYAEEELQRESYAREMMSIADVESARFRETTKFTQWAKLARERKESMDAYQRRVEDEARQDYLRTFWKAPLSTVVMDYSWPTQHRLPYHPSTASGVSTSSATSGTASMPLSVSRRSHRVPSPGAARNILMDLSSRGVEAADAPSLPDATLEEVAYAQSDSSSIRAGQAQSTDELATQSRTGGGQRLHLRRKVFHDLNPIRNQGKRAPITVQHRARSDYILHPRGQSKLAGGSTADLRSQRALPTATLSRAATSKTLRGVSGQVSFNGLVSPLRASSAVPQGTGTQPRRRRRNTRPTMTISSRNAATPTARVASAPASPSRRSAARRRARTPTAASLSRRSRPSHTPVRSLGNANGTMDSGAAAEALFSPGGGSRAAAAHDAAVSVDLRFGDCPMAQPLQQQQLQDDVGGFGAHDTGAGLAEGSWVSVHPPDLAAVKVLALDAGFDDPHVGTDEGQGPAAAGAECGTGEVDPSHANSVADSVDGEASNDGSVAGSDGEEPDNGNDHMARNDEGPDSGDDPATNDEAHGDRQDSSSHQSAGDHGMALPPSDVPRQAGEDPFFEEKHSVLSSSGRHCSRPSTASARSKSRRRGRRTSRGKHYGSRSQRKPLARYSLSYIYSNLTKPRVDCAWGKGDPQARSTARLARASSALPRRRSAARGRPSQHPHSQEGVPHGRHRGAGRPSTAPAVHRGKKGRNSLRPSSGMSASSKAARPMSGSTTRSAGHRSASSRRSTVSQIIVGGEPAVIQGDPYQVLLNPSHQPSPGFLAASPHHQQHSHAHLTTGTTNLWPVPVPDCRTTANIRPRGYILVAVPQEKVLRAQARRAARRAARRGRSTPTVAAATPPATAKSNMPLYVRRMYACVFLDAVMYLFPSEAHCRAFLRGSMSENASSCGYLDLEGVVSVKRTRIAIPKRSFVGRQGAVPSRPSKSGNDRASRPTSASSAHSSHPTSTRSERGRRPTSATSHASTASTVSSLGDTVASLPAPTSFDGIQVTTPHQSWTFFPDWRSERREAAASIPELQSAVEAAQDALLSKHEECETKGAALRRALKKGPNHRMQMAFEAAQAQVAIMQRKVEASQHDFDAAIARVKDIGRLTFERWWTPLHEACSRRNERLHAVTHEPALQRPPSSVDVLQLSPTCLRALWAVCESKTRSWLVPATEMQLVNKLQQRSVEHVRYMAPALLLRGSDAGSTAPAVASNSTRAAAKQSRDGVMVGVVLEVKGRGSYGYIRPHDRSVDQEIYFSMADATEQLHRGDEVTFDAKQDTRSAKSGDLQAISIKLKDRTVYSKPATWTHALVDKAEVPSAMEVKVELPYPHRPEATNNH